MTGKKHSTTSTDGSFHPAIFRESSKVTLRKARRSARRLHASITPAILIFWKGAWWQFRDRIIVRDNGCDLGCEDHPITDWVLQGGKAIRPKISIHHLNPSTKEDVLQHSKKLLDPENAICVSAATHKAVHYGTGQNAKLPDGE